VISGSLRPSVYKIGNDPPPRPDHHRTSPAATTARRLPPATAADAFFALYTYTVGFHQMGEVDALEFSALPPEQIPTIVALAPHLRGTRRHGGFEYGLDTLLTGLNTTHTDTAPAP
jgi:hypothetical protein